MPALAADAGFDASARERVRSSSHRLSEQDVLADAEHLLEELLELIDVLVTDEL